MKKPAKSLPDTNTIVRYLVKDDISLYTKAKDFFDRLKNGSIKAIILESVIAECIYVLTKIYQVPRERAAQSLIDILHYKGIANDDQKELILALSLFSKQGLDIVDSILYSKATESGDHLFTFDAELNKLAKRVSPT
ncbi:MAG: PIN domain-containing protein [Nitrospirae bacterium]|nr:PIN domain-containing protein [Nitrospirota bacterium]